MAAYPVAVCPDVLKYRSPYRRRRLPAVQGFPFPLQRPEKTLRARVVPAVPLPVRSALPESTAPARFPGTGLGNTVPPCRNERAGQDGVFGSRRLSPGPPPPSLPSPLSRQTPGRRFSGHTNQTPPSDTAGRRRPAGKRCRTPVSPPDRPHGNPGSAGFRKPQACGRSPPPG
jgi:hypothetical protein